MTEVLAELSEVGTALDRAEAALLRSCPPVETADVGAVLVAAEAALERTHSTVCASRSESVTEAFQQLARIDVLRDQLEAVRMLLEEADG